MSDCQGHSQRCIFCDIVRGKVEAQKVFEDDLSLVILDITVYDKRPQADIQPHGIACLG